MTLSCSWWHGVFVHFIANSSSEMHFKSLLKLSKSLHGSLRYRLLWTPAGQAIVCKTVLVASAQQGDSHKPLFPVPLFYHTPLSEFFALCVAPAILLKVEIPHYWSYARLQASRVSQCPLSLAPSVLDPSWSHSIVLVPGHSQGTTFPSCQCVWLALCFQVILPTRGSVMCRLWR